LPSTAFGVTDRIESVDDNAAGGRLGQPVDQPRECRLAGTVEPDHGDAVFIKLER
jgi:hypothetical protein